jgi:hypothetical protein
MTWQLVVLLPAAAAAAAACSAAAAGAQITDGPLFRWTLAPASLSMFYHIAAQSLRYAGTGEQGRALKMQLGD